MDTMILAAGRGERLRPLTDTIPKPLVKIQDKALIVHHIEHLKKSGFSNIIINTSYLANKIHHEIGDGSQFGVKITYSNEGDHALETGGGILKAMQTLNSQVILVINGDIFCDIDFTSIHLSPDKLAHLVLVPNPAHNPNGDFMLDSQNTVQLSHNEQAQFTFSGVGIYRRELFKHKLADSPVAKFALKEVLLPAIAAGDVSGELYLGDWTDVGTIERLQTLQQKLASK